MAFFDFFKKNKNKKTADPENTEPVYQNEIEEEAEPVSENDGEENLPQYENTEYLEDVIKDELSETEETFGTTYETEPEETEEEVIAFEGDEAAEKTEDGGETVEEAENVAKSGFFSKFIKKKAVSEQPEEKEEVSEETETDFCEAEETPTKVEEAPVEKKKQNFFARIKNSLLKTRDNILSGIEQVLSGFSEIDDDLYEELEEALIMADIGVDTSVEIIDRVKRLVKSEKIKEVSEVKSLIVRVITDMLKEDDSPLELTDPSVVLVIGVNGVGKTTTIGKLTNYYKEDGKTVMLAAADTFRAAAIDQLMIWGERNDVTVIKHSENSDPAAVVFDAVRASKNRGTNLLICDTAGRLHNKKNLMNELAKIAKVINREFEEAHKEVFLVLDATTGQNALQQAKLFKEAADITGIILTKLDGTAKGGIIIAIKNELKIPIRFIGVGEGIDDLRPFEAEEFARALFE